MSVYQKQGMLEREESKPKHARLCVSLWTEFPSSFLVCLFVWCKDSPVWIPDELIVLI